LRFEVAILSDLIFNHICHQQLLQSLVGCLKFDGFALVTFTHHRTHLIKEDLRFFELAEEEFGLEVEELVEQMSSSNV
jgi:nicotinamide N-methyltransferase